MILGVVGTGIGPFRMQLTWPEYLTMAAVASFMLLLLWRRPRPGIREIAWLVVGTGIYSLIAVFLLCALDSPLESAAFMVLVALNLWLVFRRTPGVVPRVVFLDMAACFCISYMLIPGRILWCGITSLGRTPYGDLTRSPAVIVMNMAIVAALIIGYVLAQRRHLLAPCRP